jgi:hypothetical protein
MHTFMKTKETTKAFCSFRSSACISFVSATISATLFVAFSAVLLFVFTGAAAAQKQKASAPTSSAKPSSAKQQGKKKKQAAKPSAKDFYEEYKGTWFSVQFPRGWHIRPSLKGSNGEDDSVFFTAPDSSAEFYVYCPRYTGSPTDIEINKATENQIGQTIEEKDGVRIRTVRIKAQDESYMRIFEDTIAFMVGRRLVFGFKYRDAESLKIYDPVYVDFKSSFRKFTD